MNAAASAYLKAVNHYLRHRYQAWGTWLRRRHWSVRLLAIAFTAAVVLATLWLLGVFSLVGGWSGTHWAWLRSPFFG